MDSHSQQWRPSGAFLKEPTQKTTSLHSSDTHDPRNGYAPISNASPDRAFQEETPQFGRPTKKQRLHLAHATSAIMSLICLVLGLASVLSEDLSWHLGQKNYQLIVLGLLLSIMTICLASVAHHAFLVLEARFGPSTIQNYEGILQTRIFSDRLSLMWRLILALNVVLPLGLSVAYKTFTGGESQMAVDGTKYTNGFRQHFGLFALPGLQSIGTGTGINIFSNATLDFSVSTTATYSYDTEPVPQDSPHAYGYNILSISNTTSAVLDVPTPNDVVKIQSLLQGSESWLLSASVSGTVATYKTTTTDDATGAKAFSAEFLDICNQAEASSGAKTHAPSTGGFSLNLVDRPQPGNSTRQYLAVAPDPGLVREPSCRDLQPHAEAWDVTRRACKGTWRITRGAMNLASGSCENEDLPPDEQLIITDSRLWAGVTHMPSLVEMIGTFNPNGTRKASEWRGRYFATAVAAMIWSRLVALKETEGPDKTPYDTWRDDHITAKQAGIYYDSEEHVIYTRSTLRKDGLLCFVLALQPALTLAAFAVLLVLHPTPVGKNFGLVSILAGIQVRDLGVLRGAALSGKLSRDVKLGMFVERVENGEAQLRYSCQDESVRSGRLDARILYH